MKKILLADDSITIQKVVELTFSEGDYQVICVSNGAQALKRIVEARPDIALLDVIMPEVNGYEVCEQIKRDPSTASIPVLLLTGTFEPFDQKRADAAGASGHLTKPFESQTLVTKVEELIAATPRVAAADAAGMDVIAAGEVYHVDAATQGDVGPAAPAPAGAEQGGAVDDAGRGLAEPPPPGPAVPPPPAPVGPAETAPEGPVPHPSLEVPDPGAGGSYLGFADVGLGSEDAPEIVPDRFDEGAPADGSTQRIDRAALAQELGPPSEPPPAEGAARFSGEEVDGLTGGFEVQEPSDAAGGPRSPGEVEAEAAWTPPPEAPPAETWQEAEAMPPEPPPAERGPRSPGDGAPAGLTPEAIELIAERVVQRMSDRIVREIAWEVIPQVAETLVRRRIRELEENEGS
ncbi:MAG: response regulator [Acidobacteriota bacterium]